MSLPKPDPKSPLSTPLTPHKAACKTITSMLGKTTWFARVRSNNIELFTERTTKYEQVSHFLSLHMPEGFMLKKQSLKMTTEHKKWKFTVIPDEY
jgi:hypothetical protein